MPPALGSIALAGTSDLIATGSGSLSSILSLAGTSGLVGSGVVAAYGAIQFSSTSDLIATGSGSLSSALSLAGTSDLAGGGALGFNLALAGTSDLIATGSGSLSSILSLAGTSGLAGYGSVAAYGAIQFSSTSNLIVTEAGSLSSILSLAGTSDLAGGGVVSAYGAIQFSSTSDLIGGGAPVVPGIALAGTSDLAGDGVVAYVKQYGQISLAGASDLYGGPNGSFGRSLSLAGTSAVTGGGSVATTVYPGLLSLDGTSAVTGGGSVATTVYPGLLSLAGTSAVTGSGAGITVSSRSADFSGTSELTTSGAATGWRGVEQTATGLLPSTIYTARVMARSFLGASVRIKLIDSAAGESVTTASVGPEWAALVVSRSTGSGTTLKVRIEAGPGQVADFDAAMLGEGATLGLFKMNVLDAGEVYEYSVTRNLDGSGANDWQQGDAVFNTGQAGSGFIDLYSVSSIKTTSNPALNQYGPTIVGNVRNSATYNDWTEHWAVGNLANLYDYGGTTYGAAFGKFSPTTAWTSIDATSGMRIMYGSTQKAKYSDTILLGQAAPGELNTYISAGSWKIRLNTVDVVAATSTGVTVYDPANTTSYLQITANELKVARGGLGKIRIGANLGIMMGTDTSAWSTTYLTIAGQSANYGEAAEALTAGDLLIGRNAAGKANLLYDESAGRLNFRGGTTTQAYIDTDGKIYAGGGATWMGADGLNIKTSTGSAYSTARALSFIAPASSNVMAYVFAYQNTQYSTLTLKLDSDGGQWSHMIFDVATDGNNRVSYIFNAGGDPWLEYTRLSSVSDSITLTASDYVSVGSPKLKMYGRDAITDSSDGWLRLNNAGNYASGVYTPGNIRVDGKIYLGAAYYLSLSSTTAVWSGTNIQANYFITPQNSVGGYAFYERDQNIMWSIYAASNIFRLRRGSDIFTVGSMGNVGIRHAIWSGAGLSLQGIGTTSATYGLIVYTNAGANEFWTRDDGYCWASGAMEAASHPVHSDERIKHAIKDLSPVQSRELIAQLRPRSFRMNDDPDRARYGFIAQEVLPIAEELTRFSVPPDADEADGLYSVDYAGLIAPMIQVIQELVADRDTMRSQIDALRLLVNGR